MRCLRPHFLVLILGCLSFAACGSDDDISNPKVVRPTDPTQNNPAFIIADAPKYLLVGDDLTPPTPSFTVRVTPPSGVSSIDLWLDDQDAMPLTKEGGDFVATVDATALSLGAHHALLAERGASQGFAAIDFDKGHALYVVISTDWDFSDVDDRVLAHHEELHTAHPELKITHLIGPYTFTDPAVTQARRDTIVGFAKTMRDTYGDEIGLHVHPWCNFVEAAGLTCLTQPSVVDPAGDATGYTVRLGAYTRDEWNIMFAKADEIWASVGFGKPTAFRAGAWTLEISTAQALVDSGFVVDSSANNWNYMEEWLGYEIYTWNQQQWATITSTSQPYHPTDDSILPGGDGAEIGLLEVPDNGIMVDYWTVDEMKAVFDANWNGGALETPTQVSTGFHPAPTQYYSSLEYQRLDAFFTYADQFLASTTQGPVVYIAMSDATVVW